MSKSLGNVLDPFEVMDTFGTDALRYYCFREVSFGQDGVVSTTAFEERYETELANEYGNLASRTLAMIGRYRDGVVPDGRRRPRAGGRLRRPRRARSRALLDRAEITQALERDLAARAAAEPLRRGAGAVEARQGPEARRDELDAALRSLAEGLRVVTVLLHPYMPGVDRASCSAALGARASSRSTARAFGARPGGGAVERARRRCSRSRSDRHPHPPRPRARRPRPSSSPRRARRACTRILTIGMDARVAPRRARAPPRRYDEVFAAVGRHPNERRRASTTPITRRAARARRAPALPRDRRDRPRLLPRLRAARGPGARVRRPDRARARDRQAARHPHARGRGRHDRHARRATPQGLEVILHCFSMPDRLDECLEHGWWISFAGNVTYPKAHDLARGRRARPARPPAGRDRRAVPDAAGRAQGAQPAAPTSSTPRASSPSGAGIAYEELEAAVEAQRRARSSAGERAPGAAEPAPPAGVRHPARTASWARTSSSTRTSST